MAESGTDDATTATELWLGVVAPRCLGRTGAHPLAVRVDGQCALQPPSPAANPASEELFRALAWACEGGLFALKTGNCARGEK